MFAFSLTSRLLDKIIRQEEYSNLFLNDLYLELFAKFLSSVVNKYISITFVFFYS